MDWTGQQLAETVSGSMLTVFALIAFFVGYFKGDFSLMAQIYGSGIALVLAFVIPDHKLWPPSRLFNQVPIQWLPAEPKPEAEDPPAKSTLQSILSMVGLGSSTPKKKSKMPRKFKAPR